MRHKLSFTLIVVSILLSSCLFWDGRKNRQKNYIFECFMTTTLESDDLFYFLKITNIKKDDFLKANGQNVVSDYVYENTNHKYYLIDFYSCAEDDPYSTRIESFNFLSLKVINPDVKAEPIGYVDDNKNSFTPKIYNSNPKYVIYITFNNNDFDFFKEVKLNA